MVLDTCVIFGPKGRSAIAPQEISIIGDQDGFLVVLSIKQIFIHSSPEPINGD
jgi:hypothetical protein